MFGLIRKCRAFARPWTANRYGGFARSFSDSTKEQKADDASEEFLQSHEDTSDARIKGNAGEQAPSFAKMLRYSPLVQMGNPEGNVVVGTIIETMGENIFVDFGAKFHCVCKKPRHRSDLYIRGAKVKLRLIDLELASVFMGSNKGITLHEAEGTLLGIYRDPSQKKEKEL